MPSRSSSDEFPAAAETSELADEIVRALEERGIPSGAWLVDIARVRRALAEADSLLRRLEDAVIRGADSSLLDEH